MSKRVVRILVLGLAVALMGCPSKDKKSDGEMVGNVEGDSSVSDQSISFDPTGSDSGKISGLATVNFAYDKDTLSSSARRKLAENAEWVKSHDGVILQIEGHCDSRGSIEYNLALGERRAKTVKRYLQSLGVESNKLTIISYGKEKLVSDGESESAHSQNRRANFVPISK